MAPSLSILPLLEQLTDYRRSQGRRHSQTLILTIVIMATMSGYYGYRAIGDFIVANRADLIKYLAPPKERLPSFDTVRRVMMDLDFDALAQVFMTWARQYNGPAAQQTVSVASHAATCISTSSSGGDGDHGHHQPPQHISAQSLVMLSVDGKALSSTVENPHSSYQRFVSLVSVFCQQSGQVIAAQQLHNNKRSEVAVVQQLLPLLGIEGACYTLDALHCKKNASRHRG